MAAAGAKTPIAGARFVKTPAGRYLIEVPIWGGIKQYMYARPGVHMDIWFPEADGTRRPVTRFEVEIVIADGVDADRTASLVHDVLAHVWSRLFHERIVAERDMPEVG